MSLGVRLLVAIDALVVGLAIAHVCHSLLLKWRDRWARY